MKQWRIDQALQSSPDYVDVRAISATAATPNTFDVPVGASFVSITSTGSVWVTYITTFEVEMVTNGAFAADTNWTKGGTWTIAAGVGTRTASAAGPDISQENTSLIVGRSYSVVFTVTSFTAGNVRAVLGGTLGTNRASAATFTQTLACGNTDDLILLRADATFAGSVDNISVSPISILPSGDIAGGGGPELIYPNVAPVLRSLEGISKLSIITNSGAQSVSLSYYSMYGAWSR